MKLGQMPHKDAFIVTISAALHTSVFHSLEEQIAVIDQTGNILEVNLAWQKFGAENGMVHDYPSVSQNYLETLSRSAAEGDSLAGEILQVFQKVLSGEEETFCHEYPCHSPNEQRWFLMRMTPLQGDECAGFFVISHHDITQRKQAELRAEALAMQDPLTGLGNRRAFQQFLGREMRSRSRSCTPISLLMIDIDYFKNYNDAFGHAAGDRCLIQISRILQEHARRPDDLAARIGGDEFALILGDTEQPIAQRIAESIRKAAHALRMVIDDARQATLSIGLISLIPHEGCDEDFLFQQADKALYRAKSAGRNQVTPAGLDADEQVSSVSSAGTTSAPKIVPIQFTKREKPCCLD